MGYIAATIILGMLMLAAGCSRPPSTPEAPSAAEPGEVTAMTFDITSAAFEDGGTIPSRHTADGADVSPPLSWQTPPEGTVSLALIVDDPDAPRGAWTHWVLYDLPAGQTSLPEGVPTDNALPELGGARQGVNDFRDIGYGGPSPPPGPVHHYRFTLYALDSELGLPPGASKAEVEKAMQGHVLGQARLVGTYGR